MIGSYEVDHCLSGAASPYAVLTFYTVYKMKRVVPAEQMSNSFLEDLKLLARLAA